MNDFIKDDKLIEYVVEKSKQNPRDIFELNDGRIVVNGNVFDNKVAFDKILNKARQQIKIDNFFKRWRFWKK